MVLSKALKAKLSSIGAKNCRRRAFVRPPAVVTLLHAQGPLEAPLDWLVRLVWFMWSFECSLSQWRKVFVYLWQCGRILAKF